MVFDFSNIGSEEYPDIASLSITGAGHGKETRGKEKRGKEKNEERGKEKKERRGKQNSKVDKTATKPAATIKWAAFYSDCEHEVLEVNSGHRLTLTYNLYISYRSGMPAGQPSSLNPTQLDFYSSMKAALDDPDFFTQGRTIGVGLAHAYAHITASHANLLPHSLKGIDMYLYEAARALGLTCWLRPIISVPAHDDYDWGEDDDEQERQGISAAGAFVGDKFHKFSLSRELGDDEYSLAKDLRDNGAWPCTQVDPSRVTWVLDLGMSPAEAAYGFVAVNLSHYMFTCGCSAG